MGRGCVAKLGRRDFGRVFAQGRMAAAGAVVVYRLENGRDCYRLGFAVSKRLRKAVARNRVRRLLREVSRRNPEWFQVGYDYVLLGREAAGELNYWVIERQVWEALRKLH